MPAQGLLYCTQRDLELIKLECQANEVPVEESMLLWTPAEARRFFTECIRPEPDLLAKRKVHDKAPKRPWIATNETEMLICICCCCGLYCICKPACEFTVPRNSIPTVGLLGVGVNGRNLDFWIWRVSTVRLCDL